MSESVAILGGGSFGWGLADAAARAGREVILWSRNPQREGTERIRVTQALADAADASLVFFAIPSPFVADVASELGARLDGSHFLVHTSRGVVDDRTLTQVLRATTPCRRIGALAGPIHARDLTQGAPGAGIIGTRFPEVSEAVRDVFSRQRLHVYSTDDVHGVELASTVVGLLSIVVGFGLETGLRIGTLAMIATRGMTEAARIGAALGARPETFHGLAGAGDLLAVFGGDGRPELEVGRRLAAGVPVEEVGKQAGAYIEGIHGARWLSHFIARTHTDAPLLQLVADVFNGERGVARALAELMSREVDSE
ncbi:MAG: NAD(P)-binding domain-containing protein [Nannocystaceae bacterium]|nr:NAD(P)-binding domain-containing protein [Myxococcales bacterium]